MISCALRRGLSRTSRRVKSHRRIRSRTSKKISRNQLHRTDVGSRLAMNNNRLITNLMPNMFNITHKRWMSTEKADNVFTDITPEEDKVSETDSIIDDMVKDAKEDLAKEEEQKESEAVGDEVQPEELIEETEKVVGKVKTKDFQAETKKILDIVARSLYSEKEIFVRELISNASDAMEKLRHMLVKNVEIQDPELPVEIRISIDSEHKTFTIQDTGVGMTEDEIVNNLGKIGFSGTEEFMKVLEDKEKSSALIGQFGVGFYSSFMVGESVKVYSKSATSDVGLCWESDGSGSYTVQRAEGVERGTKIIIKLRENCHEFSSKENVQKIIQTYSNFVGFNIYLNGQAVNTVRALWLEQPSQVSDEEHRDFYRFIAKGAYDSPKYTLHYQTDTPLSIRAVFYVPETHVEKYGMQKMEPGVSLYCKKVLIQNQSKALLPEWLRFVKGVVDSEDIPLNLSRELLQDSSLIKRINGVLTRRIIKFLDRESRKDPEGYNKFFNEFSQFLIQGVCTDHIHKEEIAKLLRMESSDEEKGVVTSLDEYVNRMPSDQNEIYYLVTLKRDFAESSPYYETFKDQGTEVMFLYSELYDVVMGALGEYKGKKIVSIESANAAATHKKKESDDSLSRQDFMEFSSWFKKVLVEKVTQVTESERLTSTPCIILDHESASWRRMMRRADPTAVPDLPKQPVHINTSHPIITNLNHLRTTNPDLASVVAHQIFDNALVEAGLIEDSRSMVPRLNKLLLEVTQRANAVTEGEKPQEVVFSEPVVEELVEEVVEKRD